MTDYKDENGYPLMVGLPGQEEKQEAPEPPEDIFLNWCSMDLRPLREHAVWSEQDAEGFSTNSSQRYIQYDKARKIIFKEIQDEIIKNIDLVSAKEAYKDFEKNGGKTLAEIKKGLGIDE